MSDDGQRRPSLYLSGPMSGHENWNFAAFHAAAVHLRSLGYPVINPADFGANPAESWAMCLKRDLAVMIHCERVVVLDGWEKSRGARLEVHVARELGIEVLEYARVDSWHPA